MIVFQLKYYFMQKLRKYIFSITFFATKCSWNIICEGSMAVVLAFRGGWEKYSSSMIGLQNKYKENVKIIRNL